MRRQFQQQQKSVDFFIYSCSIYAFAALTKFCIYSMCAIYNIVEYQAAFFSFKRANLYVSVMSVVDFLECEATVTHSFWQVHPTHVSCTVRKPTVHCTTVDWKTAKIKLKRGTVWGSINRWLCKNNYLYAPCAKIVTNIYCKVLFLLPVVYIFIPIETNTHFSKKNFWK